MYTIADPRRGQKRTRDVGGAGPVVSLRSRRYWALAAPQSDNTCNYRLVPRPCTLCSDFLDNDSFPSRPFLLSPSDYPPMSLLRGNTVRSRPAAYPIEN